MAELYAEAAGAASLMDAVRLDGASVEPVARRVVELLHGEGRAPAPNLVDAAEIARRFAVRRSWVYQHADELGAIRLGQVTDGRKPRLRFNPQRVAEALDACDDSRRSPQDELRVDAAKSHGRRPFEAGTNGQPVPTTPLLPIRQRPARARP